MRFLVYLLPFLVVTVVMSFRFGTVGRTKVLRHLSMVSTDNKPITKNFVEQIGSAGIASAAIVAAAAVNQAVSMRQLNAPDADKTFVYRDGAADGRAGKVDEFGLPLIYDANLIQAYWKTQGSALTDRWTQFLGYAVPYLTRVITMLVSGGTPELQRNGASLAKEARIIFEKLGPTYIKMGQMMSVRPDVLPPEALNELKILQDSVKPFATKEAIDLIESELGGPLGQFFTEISEEPVAAASLAQVYKAKLVTTGEFVAVKVQRPSVLQTVSKDLYVLRRAAEVYQGLIDRFAPQQRTNYVALLNEWAVGFYTELDFLNEASNQQRLGDLLTKEGVDGVYVPKVYNELCTRRLMVSEWIDGTKLSDCSPQLVNELIPAAQEAFLTQLLQIGFFHSDPHPGNLMFMKTPRGNARLALLDFGLVAAIKQEDMDTFISAIIHLANRDYPSLVDDFIKLQILPTNCDRPKVIPLMDKALTPYVKGGGAKKYEEELKRIYGADGSFTGNGGAFSAMTQDALTVLNDIPFSIPPYFALLARAIVTLEGIALTGNPNYGIILESYPFVARKLLSEDRPEIQRALQEVLYASGGQGTADGIVSTNRLSVLLNSALGVVARQAGGAFVDLDSLPEGAVDLATSMRFLLSDKASSLRTLLVDEAVGASDILLRQAVRKAFSAATTRLPRPPLIGRFLPAFETLPAPFLVPSEGGRPPFTPVFLSPAAMLDVIAPKLSRTEEFYAIALADAATQSFGADAGTVVKGDAFVDPSAALRFVLSSLVALPGDGNGNNNNNNNALLTDGARRLLQQLQGSSSDGRSSSSRSSNKNRMNENDTSHNPSNNGVDEGINSGSHNTMKSAMTGLSTTTESESNVMKSTATVVAEKLRDRLVDRLQPLKQQSSPLRRGGLA